MEKKQTKKTDTLIHTLSANHIHEHIHRKNIMKCIRTKQILDLLDLPVLLSHCVAFMTDLNVRHIISNTNSLVLVQF